jgi:hypothetical protein
MNKGKGILGGLRARRGPSKVSFNYDDGSSGWGPNPHYPGYELPPKLGGV